jgi:hypothetical protein
MTIKGIINADLGTYTWETERKFESLARKEMKKKKLLIYQIIN